MQSSLTIDMSMLYVIYGKKSQECVANNFGFSFTLINHDKKATIYG
jgi:hypothetical protein